MRNDIVDILLEIGIPAGVKGFTYIYDVFMTPWNSLTPIPITAMEKSALCMPISQRKEALPLQV